MVTSDGSPVVRLQRALSNGRVSGAQIRAIVAELPGPVGLEDALAILLALLDDRLGDWLHRRGLNS